MANIYPIGPRFRVTTGDHGNTLVLGDTGGTHVGTWVVQFAPGNAFTGTLSVVGRAFGKPASDDNVGFVALPYRKGYLNGALADWSIVGDGTPISAASLITIPADGLSIGLVVANSDAGSDGFLYCWPLHGPASP